MNYFGSKSRQAKYIVPIIQKYIKDYRISTYFEPFVGGANIIDKIECKRKYGSDINKYIIALFQHLQNGGTLKESYTKEIYDKARVAWYKDNVDKEFEDWEIGAIGWLCSYNGRGFDGGWGYEAMQTKSNGQVVKREFYKERKNNLLKQSAQPLWRDIHFGVGDYRDYYCNGCVVYCDPPYKGTKQFANSVKFDHEEFWNIMRDWSKRNIVLISEQEAPDDFVCIWEKEVARTVIPKAIPKSIEKLFIYEDNI
jgi:DNA adenine methylase